MTGAVRHIEIKKITDLTIESKPDLLAIEEPLEIRIGFGALQDRQQRSLSVTMRTPGHDFELAVGFLFTEGIIQVFDQIESVKYCEDAGKQEQRENIVRVELKPGVQLDFEKLQRHFYTISSCGVCGKTSIDAVKVTIPSHTDSFRMNASTLHTLPEKLKNAQHVFEHTGSLHASALFDETGNLILLREDVGRHNALDKIIGTKLFKKDIPLTKYALLVSGRASFELVQKAAVAGIPLLAAVGAPSSLAVQLAKEVNMTLLGFVREQRFNIYCGESRVTL